MVQATLFPPIAKSPVLGPAILAVALSVYLGVKVREAVASFFYSPAAAAPLAAPVPAGAPPPLDADFFANSTVGSLLKLLSSGAAGAVNAVWNLIPASTKLLLAAGIVYWGWRKWKGRALEGIKVETRNG